MNQKEAQPAAPTPSSAPSSGPATSAPPAASAAPAPVKAAGSVTNFEGGSISEKVQIVLVTPYNETVGKLKARWEEDPNMKVSEAPSTQAPAIARALMPCLVVGSIVQNTDVVKLLSMLKVISGEVKKNAIKCLLLSKIKNQAIVQAFEAYGCHEYIVEPIADRSLRFKVDLHTKAIAAQRKQLRRQDLARQEAGKGGKGGEENKQKAQGAAGADEHAGQSKYGAKKKEEKEGEVFVFKSNKVKREGKKWTMRMKGPDPSNGDWLEMKDEATGESKWRFVEKGDDPKNPKKPSAEWEGEKPQFKNGEWEFAGEKPNLAVTDEKGKKESKVTADADGLNIGKDSKLPGWKVKDHFQGDDGDESKAAGPAGTDEKKDEKKDTKRSNMDLAGLAMDFEDEEKAYSDKTDGKPAKLPGVSNALKGAASEKDEAAELGLTEEELRDPKKRKALLKKKAGAADEEPGKQRSNMDLAGLAMDFEEEEKAYGHKSKGEKPGIVPLGKGGGKSQGTGPDDSVEGEDLLSAPALKKKKKNQADSSEEEPDFGANALAKIKKAKSMGDGDRGESGKDELEGVPGQKRKKTPGVVPGGDQEDSGPAAGKRGKNKAGAASDENADEEKNPNNMDLAGLAMDFEEDPKAYGKLAKDQAKKDAAKSKGDGGADSGADELEELSPEALRARKKAKKEAAAEGDEEDGPPRARKGKGKGAAGQAAGDSADKDDELDEELDESARNFFKKKKRGEDSANSDFADDDAPAGGNSIGSGDFADGPSWGARDSEDEKAANGDDDDKVIEVDSVTARMKVGDRPTEEVHEYPAGHFGDPKGGWDTTGALDKDASGRKVFVYVEPWVHSDRTRRIDREPAFWVWRGEGRPLFNSSKKVWVFKGNKPEPVRGFDKLTAATQAFLLSISAAASRAERQAAELTKQKLADAEEKKRQGEADSESGPGEKGKIDGSAETGGMEDKAPGKKKKNGLGAEPDDPSDPGSRKSKGKSGADASEDEDEAPKKSGKRDGGGRGDAVEANNGKAQKGSGEDAGEEELFEPRAKNRGKGSDKDQGNVDGGAPSNARSGGPEADESAPGKSKKTSKESGSGDGESDEAPGKPRSTSSQSGSAGSKTPAAPLKLPAGPMLAVVLSEMLLFSENDVAAALNRFFAFLSASLGEAKFTLCLLEAEEARSVLSNNDALPVGKKVDLSGLTLAKEALERRAVSEAKDGEPFYCPIVALAPQGTPGKLLGLLIVEAPDSSMFAGKTRYLHGIAQSLRGAVDFFARQAAAGRVAA